MKRLLIMLCLVLVMIVTMVVPVSASNITGIKYQIGTGKMVYDLGLGSSYEKIGTLTVWVDSDSAPTELYVQYNTTGGWVMTQTHLAILAVNSETTVEEAIEMLPSTSPGQFDKGTWPSGYFGASDTYDSPYETTVQYDIQHDNLPLTSGEWLFIIAHASVQNDTEGTVWANGYGTSIVESVPELPAGLLLGLGLAGVGTIVIINRRRAVSAR
ncbi:MAG: hypothetical protein JXA46_00855 [Dehalococcoidales bacterium]|nr:hypothetical protein [Dehalococcoidales bacterium]